MAPRSQARFDSINYDSHLVQTIIIVEVLGVQGGNASVAETHF